ncbi:MAG: metallophosphoesterase [Hyphomicrobiaceae bacterium]
MLDVSDAQAAPQKAADPANHGDEIIERLRSGELPQMVDWFDPGLLAKVGVRSVLSATLGAYTDQRLMQAATDEVKESDLRARYDYSGTGAANPRHAVTPDANGAVWVDYIADLGDGFEATYTMAYLLSSDELKVRGLASPVPAGQLLIMGGDQVYPDATKQEYHARLRDPYDWAFSPEQKPMRKLFAIPGNHDWYDGLSAFSALFCSARDRISRGKGTQIGGWRCYQHRSYFAIKLPHNWWIWGPDIQLADNLDDSQRDYFDLMSEQAIEGHKIILCLAEPSWLHENYDNMHEISMLARQHGAEIYAVIAGDWHHYSRYASDKLGVQFITCGGGGAFAHATHGLKQDLALNWATRTGLKRTSSTTDSERFNRIEKAVIAPDGTDFTLSPDDASLQASKAPSTGAAPTAAPAQFAPAPDPKPMTDTEAGPKGFRRSKRLRAEDIERHSANYNYRAAQIYPAQWKSRLLCLKNLVLPFRNKRFAVLVGVVYFVFAWAWASSDPRQAPAMLRIADGYGYATKQAWNSYDKVVKEIGNVKRQIKESELAGTAASSKHAILTDRLAVLEESRQPAQLAAKQLEAQSETVDGAKKLVLATQIKELEGLKGLELGERLSNLSAFFFSFSPLNEILDLSALIKACEQGPLFAFLLLGLWVALVGYVETAPGWLGALGKFAIGTLHFTAHLSALLAISWLVTGISVPLGMVLQQHVDAPWPDVIRVSLNFFLTLTIGGVVGGLVMGLYWTLTSTLLNMHTGDAFGALGIKNYKHFLRIKLERDRATIYAIAIDKVPGRRGWRSKLEPGEVRPSHNPQILPVKQLDPFLIEEIHIDATRPVS